MHARRMSALCTNFERFSFLNIRKNRQKQTGQDKAKQPRQAATQAGRYLPVLKITVYGYPMHLSLQFRFQYNLVSMMSIQHRWSCWCGDFGSKRYFAIGRILFSSTNSITSSPMTLWNNTQLQIVLELALHLVQRNQVPAAYTARI